MHNGNRTIVATGAAIGAQEIAVARVDEAFVNLAIAVIVFVVTDLRRGCASGAHQAGCGKTQLWASTGFRAKGFATGGRREVIDFSVAVVVDAIAAFGDGRGRVTVGKSGIGLTHAASEASPERIARLTRHRKAQVFRVAVAGAIFGHALFVRFVGIESVDTTVPFGAILKFAVPGTKTPALVGEAQIGTSGRATATGIGRWAWLAERHLWNRAQGRELGASIFGLLRNFLASIRGWATSVARIAPSGTKGSERPSQTKITRAFLAGIAGFSKALLAAFGARIGNVVQATFFVHASQGRCAIRIKNALGRRNRKNCSSAVDE
jgi:hypothetical protein